MKVIFTDFDGVLNSEASFRCEERRKNLNVSSMLSHVACSNLQYVLDQDSSIRLVISSTWRKAHTMQELRNILGSYGVNPSQVLDKTPSVFSGNRAEEIMMWLEAHPGITKFVVLDDDKDVLGIKVGDVGHIFLTTPEDGLLLKQAKQIARLFREEVVVKDRLPGWSADGKEHLPSAPDTFKEPK